MSLPSPPSGRRSLPDRSLSDPEVAHDPAAALADGHQTRSQTPSTKSLSPPFSPDHGAFHTHLLNASSQAASNSNASANAPHLGPVRQHGLIREILNNRFVLRCALFASLGGILFGYDQGVISVTLVMSHFTSRFPQIDQDHDNGGSASFWKGFLTAMIELGAVLGVTLAGFTADKYGRKSAIETGTIFFLAGSIVQTAALKFPMLIIGRLVAGIGIGLLSMTAPMYMSEISPPNIRGALLCLEEFNIVFGIVVAFWITYGTRFIDSEFSWRFPFGLQMLPAVIILLGLSQLPPSPSWLASKGRNSECLESLATLRQLSEEDASVRKEWVDIRVEAEFQRQHDLDCFGEIGDDWWSGLKVEARKWAETFASGCQKRTLVGVGLMFFQQFVGINALIYYSPTLFATLGLDVESQLRMSGIMNICQLVGVSISFFIVDKLGRRSLLLFGSVMMTICHSVVAVLINRYSSSWDEHKLAGWVGVGFILIYMLAFGVSWGPVPWAMPSEIFPSSLRAKGVAVSTMSNWINNFIIGLITPPLVEKTNAGAFLFFAVNSCLSYGFVWFIVPETAHRSLEDMDKVFGDQIGVEDEMKKSKLYQQLSVQEL